MKFSKEFDFTPGALPAEDDPAYLDEKRREVMELCDAFRQLVWGSSDRDKVVNFLRGLGYNKLDADDDIRRALRRELFRCHPDRGGDRSTFERVVAAKELLGM